MRRTRPWSVLPFAFVLAMSACGDSAETTTTTSEPPATTEPATTTTQEPPPTTQAATTTTAEPPATTEPATTTTIVSAAAVHADLADVRPSQGDAEPVAETLAGITESVGDGVVGTAASGDHICFIHLDQLIAHVDVDPDNYGLSVYAPPVEDAEREAALAALAERDLQILILPQPDAGQVIATATQIRSDGLDASPHYVMVPTPSWKFGPGGDVEPIPPDTLGTPQGVLGESDGTVTVIDTGGPVDQAGDPLPMVGPYSVAEIVSNPLADESEPLLGPELAGHGIFVAGIVKDLAPRVEVTLWRAQFSGDLRADELSVIGALQRASVGRELGVLNLSLGTYACTAELVPLGLDAALQTSGATAIVAAAGNDGHTGGQTDPPMYPGAFDHVVAVGAAFGNGTDWLPAIAGTMLPPDDFSNQGEVWAPGVGIVSFHPATGEAIWSGTSFAAPHYAACLAVGRCQP